MKVLLLALPFREISLIDCQRHENIRPQTFSFHYFHAGDIKVEPLHRAARVKALFTQRQRRRREMSGAAANNEISFNLARRWLKRASGLETERESKDKGYILPTSSSLCPARSRHHYRANGNARGGCTSKTGPFPDDFSLFDRNEVCTRCWKYSILAALYSVWQKGRYRHVFYFHGPSCLRLVAPIYHPPRRSGKRRRTERARGRRALQ